MRWLDGRREKEWGLAVAPILDVLDVVLGTTREMLHRVDSWGGSPILWSSAVCCCFFYSPRFLHSWRCSDIMVDPGRDERRK